MEKSNALHAAAVSISIVTYNSADKIEETLRTIISCTKGVQLKIYLSDNQSQDGTADLVREKFPQVVVLENKDNRGFGWGHNQVLPHISSDFHAVVNPDIRFHEDVLTKLSDYLLAHPEVVMATTKILNSDGNEQFLPKRTPRVKYLLGGRLERFGGPFSRWRREYTMKDTSESQPFEIEFCTGCFMFARTKTLKKIGGFDERYFMYFEDADLTREMSRYGKVVFHPGMSVIHLWERASAKKLKFFIIQLQSMMKYFNKWRIQK